MIAQQQMDRPGWMALLAKAAPASLTSLADDLPPHRLLRGPEIGLTMLRGRAGGDGTAFNLGEATITRCSIALPDGRLGHCWRLGRAPAAARVAAVLDALLQGAEAEDLRRRVLTPLAAAQAATEGTQARRAAATGVQFATLAAMR